VLHGPRSRQTARSPHEVLRSAPILRGDPTNRSPSRTLPPPR
jgi:hypothetical protein